MKEIKTLADLVKAYKKGILTSDDIMHIDNDTLFVYKDDEKVFEIHPNDFIIDAAELLGIPAEYV